jgi:gluconolactonase/condensin complex subunit 2
MSDSYKVSLLYDSKSILGEGPCYDPNTNELIWVDINGKTINFFNLLTNTNKSLQVDTYVGAAIPCKTGNNVVAMIGRAVCLVDRDTGKTTELASVDPDKSDNRINDAKCDRNGRLWFGTMKIDFLNAGPAGALYCYDGKTVRQHITGIGISNGLDWSIDNRTMYYIDSSPKKVYSFQYDPTSGDISQQKVIIDYAADASLGSCDGMCIDEQGKGWIAGFGGSSVTRWDLETGERLLQIPIPALKVTSCCFGGPNYDVLYVTTANVNATPDEIQKYPNAGSLFAVTGLGVRGLPTNFFAN